MDLYVPESLMMLFLVLSISLSKENLQTYPTLLDPAFFRKNDKER